MHLSRVFHSTTWLLLLVQTKMPSFGPAATLCRIDRQGSLNAYSEKTLPRMLLLAQRPELLPATANPR